MPKDDVIISQSWRQMILNLFSEHSLVPSQFQPSMSGSTFSPPGETAGGVGQLLCALELLLCFPCTAQWLTGVGRGKNPGEEICWEFLISLECFTSILAGSTTRCHIVTTRLLIEAWKRLRLQNQTS